MRGPNWGVVVALGLGVMKATDMAKETFDRVTNQGVQPYVKSVFATGLAVAGAVAVADGWKERLLMTGGVAGTAALLHEGYAVLTTAGDRNKAQVIRAVTRSAPGAVKAASGVSSAPGARVPSL